MTITVPLDLIATLEEAVPAALLTAMEDAGIVEQIIEFDVPDPDEREWESAKHYGDFVLCRLMADSRTLKYLNILDSRRIISQVNASVAHMDISEEVARARESEDERMRSER